MKSQLSHTNWLNKLNIFKILRTSLTFNLLKPWNRASVQCHVTLILMSWLNPHNETQPWHRQDCGWRFGCSLLEVKQKWTEAFSAIVKHEKVWILYTIYCCISFTQAYIFQTWAYFICEWITRSHPTYQLLSCALRVLSRRTGTLWRCQLTR